MKNFSSLLGYLLIGLFIYLAVTKSTSNPTLFLNIHGIGIVVGGLFVAALASFPFRVLRESIRAVYRSLAGTEAEGPGLVIEIVESARALQKSVGELEKFSAGIKHPFLAQAVNLVLEGLDARTLNEILNKRIEERQIFTQSQMNVMLTLSKYSPALGLAATVLGLVDLLGQLEGADMSKLGLGMAIALSATFYGIILSNLLFAPLSEIIAARGEAETKELEMVRDGLQAALERKNPLVIGEIVNSYLEEDRRVDFVERVKSNEAA